MARGKSHTVEDSPELDVLKLCHMSEDAGLTRKAGRLFLRHGVRLQYRLDLEKKRLTARVGHEPWESVVLTKQGHNNRWRAICPDCKKSTELLYWPAATSKGRGFCRDCHGLHYLSYQVIGYQLKLRADIRSGNLRPVMNAIQSGGVRALRARQAMEAEGIADRMFTLEDGRSRRRGKRNITREVDPE